MRRIWTMAGVSTMICLGLSVPPSSAGQEVVVFDQDVMVGGACGLFVSSPPAPDPDALACSAAHHHEWWSECAHAILNARSPLGPWAPEERFAERFVAECEGLRSAATAEDRPLVEPRLRAGPHDPSRCPCSTAEHRTWVEGCLAEIDAILHGMKRWEVMDRFGRDGGISFPGKTRLRHCTCRLLKVDVEFELVPGEGWESPRDLVRSVGDPYLEYPISD